MSFGLGSNSLNVYLQLGFYWGWQFRQTRETSLPSMILIVFVWPGILSYSLRELYLTLNLLNPELNPICYLLALLGAHHFLHVSRIRVKSLTFRLLMSYIYMEHPFFRPLACWDLGFESHRGHGYLSVVSVVCCQLEVSATSWSLVQRSPTDCGASLCVI